jgi:predicted alpha/beta hydrolase family esterase
MKISKADIIMVPGYTNSDNDHWQSRWQHQMKTARRVQQEDWLKPVVEDWTANLIRAIDEAPNPVVLIAHSLGGQVVAQSVAAMNKSQISAIRGAFIVAPPDVENHDLRPRHLMTFGPYPREPFPFPSVVVASQNDPFCSIDVAADMANAWGSLFIDARESGHINSQSGHGPWPDGLMVFANFMKKLPD